MDSTTANLTPEQQELLDSGLRMLAHMIAETHLHRIALRKADDCVTPSPKMAKQMEHMRKTPYKCHGHIAPEDCHE
jgi:hypothetical protein